ncbi:MAG: hypothetical protein N3I35_08925 [Clostridia bacterium]|nr:hypothetical protein [Clostridia bacterium]
MLGLLLILVIGLCFCIYNHWFQKEKYKRLMDEEIMKQNKFSSPTAWLFYTLIFLAGIFIFFGYYVYDLFIEIFKLSKT